MIKIICNYYEKETLLYVFRESTHCPFEEDPNGFECTPSNCNKCFQERIEWIIDEKE